MSDGPTPKRWRLWLFGATVVAAAAAPIIWLNRPSAPAVTDDAIAFPPYSDTRFLNTGPDAQYIGSAACAGCHKDNHASYLHTAHSKALSDLDVKAEPPDGAFEHQPSGRSYRVYRQGDQMRQEEVARSEDGKEIARIDVAIRYLIGSGNYSRSYLVDVEGFLHQSPITWYSSKKQWGMSPGYDSPVHASFERPVGLDCVVCHTGRAEPVGEAFHRLKFHEKAIGCESCHGPGSLHLDFYRTHKLDEVEDIPTIVHPGKLSRRLLDDICASCHMSGAATVELRGRKIGDFRPGRPMTDYRMPYHFDRNEKMTVVGHTEQLQLSACYQKSEKLTCVTCHNPHQRQPPKDTVAFYRKRCLNCHETQPCKLEPAERIKKDATDNCVTCHMPRGDTEIPHIAFTHHRIGKHDSSKAEAEGGIPELKPVYDDSHLSPLDRRRNLGLAYLQAAMNPKYRPFAQNFRDRGWDELHAVEVAGICDPEMALALAQVYWTVDREKCREYARQASEAKDAPSKIRIPALTFLRDCDMQGRKYESAIESLEKLIRIQRNADDWRLLGVAYLKLGQPAKAVPALETALTIRPFRHSIHAALSDAHRQLGNVKLAEEYDRKGRWLFEHRQD